MREKRSYIDVSLSPSLLPRFGVMNDCDESVAVVSDVEDYISVCAVSVVESPTDLRKIVPSNLFDDSNPRLDLIRCIWIILHGVAPMFERDDVHLLNPLHNS